MPPGGSIVPAGMIAGAVTRAGSLSRNRQPLRSAVVPPTLISSTQSPGVPPLDSTSLMRTSAGAAGAGEQTTLTVPVSAQSPSLTVSVRVDVPAAVQNSVGFAVAAPASMPDVALHAYVTVAGWPSESCAAALSALEKPTITSPGLALIASTTGQTLNVPLIWTLPVRAGSRHCTGIIRTLVILAATPNIPVPLQLVTPSVAVAVIVAVYPLPAGMPPSVTEIV